MYDNATEIFSQIIRESALGCTSLPEVVAVTGSAMVFIHVLDVATRCALPVARDGIFEGSVEAHCFGGRRCDSMEMATAAVPEFNRARGPSWCARRVLGRMIGRVLGRMLGWSLGRMPGWRLCRRGSGG